LLFSAENPGPRMVRLDSVSLGLVRIIVCRSEVLVAWVRGVSAHGLSGAKEPRDPFPPTPVFSRLQSYIVHFQGFKS
jgi:hypothetical protein